MASAQARVAVATLNQTVGDWSGNARRIGETFAEANHRGVRLLLLPEMCIPGYSLGDRLLRGGTIERSWDRAQALAEQTGDLVALVGLPIRFENVLFNAMAVLAGGRIAGLVAKENLATGDVEYEHRYFQPWPSGRLVPYEGPDGTHVPLGTQMFQAEGIGRFGIEICEDAWKGIRPGSLFALAGAELIVNPSASWFAIGKHRVRRRMIQQASEEDCCAYLYTSLVGCDATRLVFDGSMFIAVNGRIEGEGPRFVFEREWTLMDRVIDLAELHQTRMEKGSWRDQQQRLARGDFGQVPNVTRLTAVGRCATNDPAPAPRPYWLPPEPEHPDPSLRHLETGALRGRTITEADLNHLELELALALGLRDHLRKSGIDTCCLALSGGRDSAMVAYLVHRMQRYDHPELDDPALRSIMAQRLICAYLATDNSSRATREAARTVAEEIGATFHLGDIQPALDQTLRTVAQMTGVQLSWDEPRHDLTLQNIQARMRGTTIWTIANLHRALLLVTSNKSEAAVGYTTMDGDSSGGLAPLADVPKSLVMLWLDWAARFHGYRGPQAIAVMAASAELRPPDRVQSDEEDLMPFTILDQLMYAFVQLGLDPLEIFRRFWPVFRDHPRYRNDPRPFAADICKFVRLMCFAQWKRDRQAISFRVTAFDLDPKTGFRFPAVQSPFVEELAELDAYVADLISNANPT